MHRGLQDLRVPRPPGAWPLGRFDAGNLGTGRQGQGKALSMIWVAEVRYSLAIYHDHEIPSGRRTFYLAGGLASLGRRGRLGVLGDHANRAAPAPGAELDPAADQSEQSVIAATADAEPGMEVSSVLADDDLASAHELAAKPLDPESLGVGVAPVPAG
jgi:hypothetical protein